MALFLKDLDERKSGWIKTDYNQVLATVNKQIEKRKKDEHLKTFRVQIQKEAQNFVKEVIQCN